MSIVVHKARKVWMLEDFLFLNTSRVGHGLERGCCEDQFGGSRAVARLVRGRTTTGMWRRWR